MAKGFSRDKVPGTKTNGTGLFPSSKKPAGGKSQGNKVVKNTGRGNFPSKGTSMKGG